MDTDYDPADDAPDGEEDPVSCGSIPCRDPENCHTC
jgi:hypothetical protein